MSRLSNLSQLMLLAEKYGEYEVLKLCIKEMDAVAADPSELVRLGKHSLMGIDTGDIVQKYQENAAMGDPKKVEFIKEIRARTGAGLKEAKDYVETIKGFEYNPWPQAIVGPGEHNENTF